MLIKDLSKDLDAKAMTAVRGGDNGSAATNSIIQGMSLNVPVGVLTAGPGNTNVDVNGKQNGSISSQQYSGDAFLAFFPSGFLRS